jgi:tetratricopeptide (TPR) repeat protein
VPDQAYRALLTLARQAHAALYGGDFEVIHSAVPAWDAPPELLEEIREAPLAWFEQERANIRAAVSHCAALGLTAICWDLAVSAHEFYTVSGYHDDWLATHQEALAACRAAGDQRGEGIVLACLGQPALVASRAGGAGLDALHQLERAVALLGEAGDRHGRAIAQRTLANALRRRGHLAAPLRLFAEARDGYAAAGDTVGRWQAQRYIGQTYLDLGQHEAALRELRAAQDLAEQLGTPRPLVQTQYWTGQALLAAGQPEAARAAFTVMLDLLGEAAGLGHAYAEHGLGEVAGRAGHLGEAADRLERAAELARAGDDVNLEGRVAMSAAAVAERAGRPEQRTRQLEHAVTCFIDCQAEYLQVAALAELARAQQDLGLAPAALATWSRIEALYAGLAVGEPDRIHRRPPGLEP